MSLAIEITSIILASIALLVALASLGISLGTRWSSHRIEWKPLQLNDSLASSDEEFKDVDDEDGKILKEALNLQRRGKRAEEIDPLSEVLETNNF